MDREQILALLRTHQAELSAAGVLHVSLFGSMARGDARPNSYIDIAVKLAATFSQGGFDYFSRFDSLQRHLSKMLDRDVDVIAEPAKKAIVQQAIDQDRTLAF